MADVGDGLTLRLTLTKALRALPRRQREAVVLHYLAGLKHLEIADVLGISSGSVARHVHRGLAALRAQLDELAPGAAQVTQHIIKGGIVRVTTLPEAARLKGTDQLVTARVTGRVGGTALYTVDIGMPAVLKLPGRPGGEPASEELIGQEVECVVVEVDEEEQRVLVASVPSGPEEELYRRRTAFISALRPGEVLQGTVISVVPFGAFVDIGDSVYGLLHVSELGSVDHPQEALDVGQGVRVEVLDTSPVLERVSLRLAEAA
ncbi:MAG: sigma-70 family RNA polymerase sigma factor [Streptosporangiales bacterium]|nr:sigma-70 family RNA polymerase sigma factor [Streptosporangiales bacterium]